MYRVCTRPALPPFLNISERKSRDSRRPCLRAIRRRRRLASPLFPTPNKRFLHCEFSFSVFWGEPGDRPAASEHNYDRGGRTGGTESATDTMSKRGRGGGAGGNRYRVTLGLPVGALINCADNTGAKNIYIIAVKVRNKLADLVFQGCCFCCPRAGGSARG